MSENLRLKSCQFINTANILLTQCQCAETEDNYLSNAAMHSIYYSTFLRVKYILDKIFASDSWVQFIVQCNNQLFNEEKASHKEVIEKLAQFFSFIKSNKDTLNNFSTYQYTIQTGGKTYLMSNIITNINKLKDNRHTADYKDTILLKKQVEKQYQRAKEVLQGLEYIDIYFLSH